MLLLGSLMTLAYAPFSFWVLVPMSLTLLFVTLRDKTPKEQFALGFSFGLGWFGVGVSWVHVSIADFGGLPLIGSLGLMALLCGYLALFPAITFLLMGRYIRWQLWPLALPLCWLIMEWVRSWFLTGFPWLSLGYSQVSGPLAGWIPIIGETGLSALLIAVCAALANTLIRRQIAQAGVLIVAPLVSGWVLSTVDWVSPTDEYSDIAMVQGNIKQALRWVPEQDRPTMDKYQKMTEPLWDNDVIIWPEAAVPKIEPTAVRYLRMMDDIAASENSALITGIVNYNFETREAYNNLLVLGKRQSDDVKGHYRYEHSNRFDKHHLLPIGEFIPMEQWLRGLAPIFDLPMSSFSIGDYQQANLVANGRHFAPAICFEIAFPRQIRANLYKDTDFIITVSNDAWFGDSHGPAQHLEIAQVRALEFGLPVLRSTNSGITAFIDPKGKIQSRLPQFQAAVISDRVHHVTGSTPYRQFGDTLAWLTGVLSFACALWLMRSMNGSPAGAADQ